MKMRTPRGWGWLTNPRKAAYNRAYYRRKKAEGAILVVLISAAFMFVVFLVQIAIRILVFAIEVLVKGAQTFLRWYHQEPPDHPEDEDETYKFLNPSVEKSPQNLLSAKVILVLDGDTVDVSCAGNSIRIRLDSIDCPEGDQPWGNKAKYGLIKLIGNKQIDLEIYGLDIYGRTLATIYVQQGSKRINVNEKMVSKGHAWVMRMYYDHLPPSRKYKMNVLENFAKSKRVGLWGTENPIPPWQWRKSA